MRFKRKTIHKFFYAGFLLIFLVLVSFFFIYKILYSVNLTIPVNKEKYIYIPSHSDFERVIETLTDQLISPRTFRWVAKWMNYPSQVKPGRYDISGVKSNIELVRLLRSGKQNPVRVVLKTNWELGDICKKIDSYLEIDSAQIHQALLNNETLKKNNTDSLNIIGFILPDTYFINWTTTADSLASRFIKESEKFWTMKKIARADEIGFSRREIIVLASIVWREVMQEEEMPRIAGVYLNRLQKKMRLEADPTIKYALHAFSLRRILKSHLEIESPFNTYKISGLPPGPICNPPAKAIDAVLYAEKHDFLFFCAKPGGGGYHNFAETAQEHVKNAQLFHRYLNSIRIYK